MRLNASLGVLSGIAWTTSGAVVPRNLDYDIDTTCTSTETDQGTVFVTVPGGNSPTAAAPAGSVFTLTVPVGGSDPGAGSPGSFGSPSGSGNNGLLSSTCTTESSPFGSPFGSARTLEPVTITITALSTPMSTVTIPVSTITINTPGAGSGAGNNGNGNSPGSIVTVTAPQASPSPAFPGSGSGVTITIPGGSGSGSSPAGVTVTVPQISGQAGEVVTLTIPEGPSQSATVVLTVTIPDVADSPGSWSTIVSAPGLNGATSGPLVTVIAGTSAGPQVPTNLPLPGSLLSSTCSDALTPGAGGSGNSGSGTTLTVPLPQLTTTQGGKESYPPFFGGPIPLTITYTIPAEPGMPTPLVETLTVTPNLPYPPGDPGSSYGPTDLTIPLGPFGVHSTVSAGDSSGLTLVTYTVPADGNSPGYTGVFTLTPGAGSSPSQGSQNGGLPVTVTVPEATQPGQNGGSSGETGYPPYGGSAAPAGNGSPDTVTSTVPQAGAPTQSFPGQGSGQSGFGSGNQAPTVRLTVPAGNTPGSGSGGQGSGPGYGNGQSTCLTLTIPGANSDGQSNLLTVTVPAGSGFPVGGVPSAPYNGPSDPVTVTAFPFPGASGLPGSSPSGSGDEGQSTCLTLTLTGANGQPSLATVTVPVASAFPNGGAPSAPYNGPSGPVTVTVPPTPGSGSSGSGDDNQSTCLTLTLTGANGPSGVVTVVVPETTDSSGSFPGSGPSGVVTVVVPETTDSSGSFPGSGPYGSGGNGPSGVLTVTVPDNSGSGSGPSASDPYGYGGGSDQPGVVTVTEPAGSPSAASGSPVVVTYTVPAGPGETESSYAVTYTLQPSSGSGSSPSVSGGPAGYGSGGSNPFGSGFNPTSSSAGLSPVTITLESSDGFATPVVVTYTPGVTGQPSSSSPTPSEIVVSESGTLFTITLPGSGSLPFTTSPASSEIVVSEFGTLFTITVPATAPAAQPTVASGSVIVPGYGSGAGSGAGSLPSGLTAFTITPTSGSPYVVTIPIGGGSGSSPSNVLTVTEGPSPSGYGTGSGSGSSPNNGEFTITIDGTPVVVPLPQSNPGGNPATGSGFVTVTEGGNGLATPAAGIVFTLTLSGTPVAVTAPASGNTASVGQGGILTVTEGLPSGQPSIVAVPAGAGGITAQPSATPYGGSFPGGEVITVIRPDGHPTVLTIPGGGNPAATQNGPSNVLTITEGGAAPTGGVQPGGNGVGTAFTVTLSSPGNGQGSGPQGSGQGNGPQGYGSPNAGVGSIFTITQGGAGAAQSNGPILTVSEVVLSETIPIGSGLYSVVAFTTTLGSGSGSGSGSSPSIVTIDPNGSGNGLNSPSAIGGGAFATTLTLAQPSAVIATALAQSPQVVTVLPSIFTVWPHITLVTTTSCTTSNGGAFFDPGQNGGFGPSVVTMWPTYSIDTTCTKSSTSYISASAVAPAASSESSTVLMLSSSTLAVISSAPSLPSPSDSSTVLMLSSSTLAVVSPEPATPSAVAPEPVSTASGEQAIPTLTDEPPSTSNEVQAIPTLTVEPAEPTSAAGGGQPTEPTEPTEPTSTAGGGQPIEPTDSSGGGQSIPVVTPEPSTSSGEQATPALSFEVPPESSAGEEVPPPQTEFGLGHIHPRAAHITVIPTPSSITPDSVPTASVACGSVGDRGGYTFRFDDIPAPETLNSDTNSAMVVRHQPVPRPYHRFLFSDDFRVVPPPQSRFVPSSGSQMLQYDGASKNVAHIGLAQLRNNPCFHFDFLGVSLGCNSTVEPCVFNVKGIQWNGVHDVIQANKTLVVGACKNIDSCVLRHQILDSAAALQFTNLTAVNITMTVAGQPVTWWADDFQVAWTENDCSTAACRALVPNTASTPQKPWGVSEEAKAKGLRWSIRR
ncbi:hypothetical protein QR685DRAFT_360679 [Neurospora intermedia]|uniref:DUF7371 domain-containing protein n=1 Tax=Neurospora intermedia TaxID=5142 RepID=A0ABR3D484_NEUIN